ncbi:MAG: DUF4197 domain-containing protein [Betaproteobacteria bacterium]|nr:DUF4197 domain-containing protein [Betaproteobacteria bacterium]
MKISVRHILAFTACTVAFAVTPVRAITVQDLTQGEVADGLKEALTQGALNAVDLTSKLDGFFGNDKIKIPLPPDAAKLESMMRKVRLGKYADELVLTLNRAAEAATPEARALLVEAVKGMSIAETKNILTGPENSATEYFRAQTSDGLRTRFLPIVEQATQKVQLARVYDKFAGKASKFGLIKAEQADLNAYVTQKALDGLFAMIADEEKKIRANPMKSTKDMARKVFGALIK